MSHPAYKGMSGIENVIFERARQIGKGFNDQAKENADCQLVECAGYILGDYIEDACVGNEDTPNEWPQDRAIHVKNKYGLDYVCRLRIAAALIAAEIDRIQLLALQPTDQKGG